MHTVQRLILSMIMYVLARVQQQRSSLKRFVKAVVKVFGAEYLRRPNDLDYWPRTINDHMQF